MLAVGWWLDSEGNLEVPLTVFASVQDVRQKSQRCQQNIWLEQLQTGVTSKCLGRQREKCFKADQETALHVLNIGDLLDK